jgi:hypothetical protein
MEPLVRYLGHDRAGLVEVVILADHVEVRGHGSGEQRTWAVWYRNIEGVSVTDRQDVADVVIRSRHGEEILILSLTRRDAHPAAALIQTLVREELVSGGSSA